MNILYLTSSSFLDSDLPLLKAYKNLGHSVYLIVKIVPFGLKSTIVSIQDQYNKEGLFNYIDIYRDEFEPFKQYTDVDKLFIMNMLTNSTTIKNIYYSFNINRLIKKYNIDVFHRIGIPCIMTVPSFITAKCKNIVTIHDPIPHEKEESLKLRTMRILVLKFIQNIILLNNTQTEYFKKHYKVKKMSIFYSKLGNYEALCLYGREQMEFKRTILFFGRISQYKGIDVLLKAFMKIKDKYDDVKLIIAGNGKFNFDVTLYRNEPRIKFMNHYISLEDLCTLIRSCEFVVCPYTSATQSGVVASVLALNKPLIVTNVGGLSSMIVNEKSGIVIGPNNENELALAMSRLLSDNNLLESMSKYIKKSSEDGNNSWIEIAQKYINIYNSI